jgi:mono/diheme cytochrome c family protein
MKKFLGSVAVGVCLPFLAAYLFVTFGGMPVATKGLPLPFEKAIARKALKAAIGPEADRPSPLPAEETNLLAGARVYEEQCALCHGLLGRPESVVAKGMYPSPPQLLPPKRGVTDDPVGETHWKVMHGIRLTGMPGFEGNLTDPEMWQVSLLLLHADKLPASVQTVLRGE